VAFASHACAAQARFEREDLPSDKHSYFERFYDPWARRKFAGHPDFIMISSDEYQAEREFWQLRECTNGSKTKGDFESLPRPRLLGAVLTAHPYLVTPKGIDHFIESTSLRRLLLLTVFSQIGTASQKKPKPLDDSTDIYPSTALHSEFLPHLTAGFL
jgi:hypothetical protein